MTNRRSPTEAGIREIRTLVGICHLCGQETPTQARYDAGSFMLPSGWERLKYDYYCSSDYFLFCPTCVNVALGRGYERYV